MSRRGRYLAVARTVAWRNLHSVVRSPALILPPLIFPLFFYMAFAGGLSAVAELPGFDYYDYNAFQFVFVLLQSAAFGGRVHRLLDRRRLRLGVHPASPPRRGRPLGGDRGLRGRGPHPDSVRLGDGLRDCPGHRARGWWRRDRPLRAGRPRTDRQSRRVPLRGGDDDANADPPGGAGDAAAGLLHPDDVPGIRATRPAPGLDRDRLAGEPGDRDRRGRPQPDGRQPLPPRRSPSPRPRVWLPPCRSSRAVVCARPRRRADGGRAACPIGI